MKQALIFTIGFMYSLVIPSHAGIVSHYGVSGSFTRSTLDTDWFDNYSAWRSGFNIGIFVENDLMYYLSIIPRLEYCQRGYIQEQVETDENGNEIQEVRANTRLDYLSLPLSLKVKYPAGGVTPFVTAGLRLDYLVNHSRGTYEFTSVTAPDELSDHLSPWVLGSSFSLGLQAPVSQRHDLILEVRHNRDITDSAKEPIEYGIRNRSYDVLVGLAF